MDLQLLSYLNLANLKKEEMKENIYKWYIKEYPNDEEAEYINREISFYDLFAAMCFYNENDAYEMMIAGTNDSVVRERIFQKITEILNTNYDLIYNLWLNKVFKNTKEISLMFTYISNLKKIENVDENEAFKMAIHEFLQNALTIAKIVMFCENEDYSFIEIRNDYEDVIVGNYWGIILHG